MFHEGVPEGVWLYIALVRWEMAVVEMRPTVKKPDAVEVLANVHVPVVANVLGDRLLQKWSPDSLVGADLGE